MKRCIATVCLSGTLEDKLHAGAAAGFDGVEIFENDLVNSRATPHQIRALVTDLGLSIDEDPIVVRYEAQHYAFDKVRCKRIFQENPDRWLDALGWWPDHEQPFPPR